MITCIMLAVGTSCSKHDAPLSDTSVVLRPALPDTASSAPSTTAASPVRGVVTSVSDTAIAVSSPTGEVQVHVTGPLHVYTRTPSDLGHVTPHSFVGVTSVKQPGGSQRATEIHVFPEALRGTGEGSRLMAQTGGDSARNTMTNGTVSPSRMTNGSVAGSTMTNGTVGAGKVGSSMTVEYQGGTQTITVPAGVTVTAITETHTPLAVGANVTVLATKSADGRLSASTVILSAAKPTK
jgi:hypothetical protein